MAQLPSLLISSDSLAGFISRLREVLKLWFSCDDVELFMYEQKGSDKSIWVYEDREAASTMDKKTRKRSVIDRVVSVQVPKRRFSLVQKGISIEVAKQSSEGKGAGKTHITDDTSRDNKYFDGADGKCRSLLTSGLCDDAGNLIAVLQLRDRIWRESWREKKNKPDKAHLAKCSGFTSTDGEWLETLRAALTNSLVSALRKEETRLNKLQARMADRRALAIMTITEAIAKSIPTDELFATVVQEVISLLNCDRATMWLLTPDRARLWSMVQSFPPRPNAPLIRLEVPITGTSLAGACAMNDEVINLPDAYDDARFEKRFDKQTGYRTRSMLIVPITSEQSGDVLGCLQCLNKQNVDGQEEGVVFNQEDTDLAQAFTAIAAVAIVQSKLEGAADYGVGMAIKVKAATRHDTD